MQYEAIFKDKNAAGWVLQRLKEAYRRTQTYVPGMLRVEGARLFFQAPETGLLEQIASKANLKYKLQAFKY